MDLDACAPLARHSPWPGAASNAPTPGPLSPPRASWCGRLLSCSAGEAHGGSQRRRSSHARICQQPWDSSSLKQARIMCPCRSRWLADGDTNMRARGTEGFWGLLTAAERQDLSALGRDIAFAPHATMCVEGDRATHLFIIVDGWVKIFSVTENGHEMVLALRGYGDIVGEISGETAGYRTATIQAIDAVRALIVGYDRSLIPGLQSRSRPRPPARDDTTLERCGHDAADPCHDQRRAAAGQASA